MTFPFLDLDKLARDASDRPSPEQIEGYRRMTPEQKLAIAGRLREEGIRLIEAGVRSREPEFDDAAVRRRVFEILCRG